MTWTFSSERNDVLQCSGCDNTNNSVLPKSEYKKSVSIQQFRRNRNTLVFGNVNDFDYDEPSSANCRYVL